MYYVFLTIKYMNISGPSFAIDTACSSSMVALHAAWSALTSGEIDSAIVAGTNLTLKPQSSLQFHCLNMLANDGKCKAFDASGNGYGSIKHFYLNLF